MKHLLKKIPALLLAAAILFSAAACGGDGGMTTKPVTTAAGSTTTDAATSEGETTTMEETTTGETTTTPVTTLPVTTTKPVTTKPATTKPVTTKPPTTKPATTKPATTKPPTTKPAGITFPVNGSMAKVIAFYNQYANAMKTYKGKVTVTKKDGTTSTITSVSPGFVRGTAEEMLPNDYTTKPTYTFVNGVSTKDGKSLTKWLPRGEYTKMSELAASGTNGVQSAACVKSGTGCKVTIVMKDDKTSGATALSDKPKYVSKCMDTLDLGPEDLDPFKLKDATVNYTGCKIEAVFNAKGLMTKLDITTPANIKGNLSLAGIPLVKADVIGTYKGNYTFTY